MKTALKLSVFVVAGLLLCSCSSLQQLRPLSSGEARLTYIEMPEFVREDIPYDVILSIDSEETPEIRQVCFRWVAEESASASPSLYSHSTGSDFTVGSGPAPASWIKPGVNITSESFCAGPSDIKSDIPGRLIVRIRPANLKPNYCKLEGRVEYVADGQVKISNAVNTRIIVEK